MHHDQGLVRNPVRGINLRPPLGFVDVLNLFVLILTLARYSCDGVSNSNHVSKQQTDHNHHAGNPLSLWLPLPSRGHPKFSHLVRVDAVLVRAFHAGLITGTVDMGQSDTHEERLDSTATSESIPTRPPRDHYRKFQAIKNTNLGINAPNGFHLEIHSIDGNGVEIGIPFHTTKQLWIGQRLFMPPSFKLMTGPWVPNNQATTSADPTAVAHINYKGFSGLLGLHVEVEVDSGDGTPGFHNDIPDSAAEHQRSISIRRQGLGRTYSMELKPSGRKLQWQGSKQAAALIDDDAPLCNGNLKLFDPAHPFEPEMLALWKNRTDMSILGALYISESTLASGQLTVEEVMSSCLAIVLAERVTARGWLGGMGEPIDVRKPSEQT